MTTTDLSAFRLNPATGWCRGARWQASPNHDQRSAGIGIDLLVIHGISLPAGSYGGPHIEDLFLNRLDCAVHESFADLRDLRVSAHFLLRRDGACVQFVPTIGRAWHAGVSSWEGRSACNDYSLGIELEGCDGDVYTSAQYSVLTTLTLELMRCYPAITPARIVGHSDIAPGRKTDPGSGFDWAGFRRRLSQASE